MDEKEIFAKNLNYYMNKNNKTQTDLVEDLNLNKSTISTWVNALKMPRMGTIQTLADYFGIMKSDLIENKDHDPNPTPASDEEIKFAFFGGAPDGVSDKMYQEVKDYVEFLKSKHPEIFNDED